MNNVKFIEIENPMDGTSTTHAVIDHGEGHLTTMPKENYEAQLAAQEARINANN
jgi:hypothetical protein